jgi:hypothetical protein
LFQAKERNREALSDRGENPKIFIFFGSGSPDCGQRSGGGRMVIRHERRKHRIFKGTVTRDSDALQVVKMNKALLGEKPLIVFKTISGVFF